MSASTQITPKVPLVYINPSLLLSLLLLQSNEMSSGYQELPAQAYLATYSNRPAVAALNGLLSSFPVVKIFTGNAVPIMVYRQQQQVQK